MEKVDLKNAPERTQDRNSEQAKYSSQTGKDFLLNELPKKATKINNNLRTLLFGTIQIFLSDTKEYFTFKINEDMPEVTEGNAENPECQIMTSEKTLLAILNGDINPQIAMLKNAISLRGKINQGIYFFNLVAPE
jgi:putative sterol carrier protein